MLKERFIENYKKIIRIIGFVVFLVIAFRLFCNITYLFRNASSPSRAHITGIKNEKELDMVYVGGSAAYVYWQPLRAWNDCGFTSYNYASDTIQAESLKAYIKKVRAARNPELYVIDARAFEYYGQEETGVREVGIRNGTDSMDITSPARYELLLKYLANRFPTENTDELSFYLDISKYHTNTGNLGLSDAWKYMDNRGTSPNKGWEWIDNYAYLEEPQEFATDERAELHKNSMGILEELLSYCQAEKLNVLFVVCPYHITKEEYAKYNTIEDAVKSYGFGFLNANDYYSEMELDFTTDFYNRNHVNLFGAAKYTAFLESYICSNYHLPDHREDSGYDSWDEDYQRFLQEEKQHAGIVQGLASEVMRGEKITTRMKKTSAIAEWSILAEDSRYTLLIEANGDYGWPRSISEQKILKKWGLAKGKTSEIRVVSGTEITYSNATDKMKSHDGTLGPWQDIAYHMSVGNDHCLLTIDGEEVPIQETGINIVVFDNNYRTIADTVFISCEDGTCVVNH